MATTKSKPKKTIKSVVKTTPKPTTSQTSTTPKPTTSNTSTKSKPSTSPPGFYESAYAMPDAPTQQQYVNNTPAPTMADRVTYTDKSMADLSAQFGFKTDQAWFEDLAQKQAQIQKDGITAEQVKTQRGLNQANAMIDSDYFQQGLKNAQGIADRGLNAGMATEQGTRLAMSRQSALGGAYADAQGQMFQLGQQKIAADKQASIDALNNWQDAVWKGADFTQRYNQDQYGRTQDTNNWNMQKYESERDQWNQDRNFGYQQVQDTNAWNMNMYETNLNQRNVDRQFGYDKAVDSRNYKRSVYESDRDYNRNKFVTDRDYKRNKFVTDRDYKRSVYTSDRDYNRGVKESDREFSQRRYEFKQNYGLDSKKLQLDQDRFAFEKIQASKVGSGGGGGGGRSYGYGGGRSSGGSSGGSSRGSSGGGGYVVSGSTGTGKVNMQKEIAAQRSSSGASKGMNILIGNVKSSQSKSKAKKSLGLTAPHLTGVISPSKSSSRNKYTDLARGRLW